jgi:D-alanyl-lipoteichoic acid acyltransferase DltB (MBOAT superfamily)
VIIQSFGQLNLGLWRLLGLRARRPVADNILLSRTPADFWRRWSWPIHLWLYRYVYQPCGGRRRHVRAVLVVFLVSGLLHEILAAVAIGRVTGHQTLYFMISAIGVLASPTLLRLERFGLSGEIVMRGMTILFLAASATIMFASFGMILPIYHKHIWLNW